MKEPMNDSQANGGEPTKCVQPTPERRAVDAPGAEPETVGVGGISQDAQGVVGLGVENSVGSDAGWFTGATRIKSMITLPRITGYAVLLFLGILLWYRLYPYDPIHFNQLPIPVLNENNEVHAGENLLLFMDFEKLDGCENIQSKFYLVDGFVLEMTTSTVTRPVGKNQFLREIPIPPAAPTGPDRHIRIEYSCQPNPIRTIYYSWDTEQFTVLPKEE